MNNKDKCVKDGIISLLLASPNGTAKTKQKKKQVFLNIYISPINMQFQSIG